MQPPILQWKVSLALLVVVIAAVSIGSALHSTGTPHQTRPRLVFFGTGTRTDPRMALSVAICRPDNFRNFIRLEPPAHRSELQRELRRACRASR